MFSLKYSVASKVFALVMVASIVVPNTFLFTTAVVSAQETDGGSASQSSDSNSDSGSDSSNTSNTSDSSSSSDTSVSDSSGSRVSDNTRRDLVRSDESSTSAADNADDNSTDTAADTADQNSDSANTNTGATDPADETPSNTNSDDHTRSDLDKSVNGNDDSSDTGAKAPAPAAAFGPAPMGTIQVCKMIVDSHGNLAHSATGLPNGTMTVKISSTADVNTSTVQTVTFDAATFAPNTDIMMTGTNNAECRSYTLPINPPAYFYGTETITGSPKWQGQYYSDEEGGHVMSLHQMHAYNLSDWIADGKMEMTTARPERTLIIMSQYLADPATIGSLTVCKMIVMPGPNGGVAQNNTGLPAADFSINFMPRSTPTSNVQTVSWDTTTYQAQWPGVAPLDADCQKFDNLPLQEYIYSQESITNSLAGLWQTPKYLEQHVFPVDTSLPGGGRFVNFFPYSPELFDNDPSNDASRRISTDGVIALTPDKPNGLVVIMNKLNDFTLGSIDVCKMIVDENNNIKTSSAGLPSGSFSLSFTENVTLTPTIRTVNFEATSFAPNMSVLTPGQNDAECKTVNNLPIVVGSNAYYHTEEVITNSTAGTWQPVLYNDQFDIPADDLNDFFEYHLDDPTFINSDGHIVLSPQRTHRMLLILNRYNSTVNQNHAPTIDVLGANPMDVILNSTFTDPGATANDQEDGNLTNAIVTSGNVDVNTLGSYTITYSVTDSGGLSASATRTVNVIENTDDNNNGTGGGSNRGGRSGSRKRVPNIQGEILGAAVEPATCVYLKDHLRRDWNNDRFEVLKLQYFLMNLEGHSNLQATGVFDDATYAAVSEFQNKYFDDILKPWGHTAPTGFVYILTKKKVNEIVCRAAFPVSAQEQEEINNFRTFLENLRANGIALPGGSMMGDGMMDDKMDDKMMDDVSNMVGMTDDENFTGTGGVDTSDLKAVAAAIFSVPNSREAMLQSLYFLLIAVIAVYLFTEIIVGSRDTSKLNKYQIWARKTTGYLIGLILAIIVAVWYQVFSIVVPLLVLAIISAVFLVMSLSKKNTTSVINLPPKK